MKISLVNETDIRYDSNLKNPINYQWLDRGSETQIQVIANSKTVVHHCKGPIAEWVYM